MSIPPQTFAEMCCPFTCWPNILLVPTEPFPNSCGEKRGVLSGHSFVALQCSPRWDKMKWPWLGYRKVLLRCRGMCKLITKTRIFFGAYHRRIGKVPLKEVLKRGILVILLLRGEQKTTNAIMLCKLHLSLPGLRPCRASSWRYGCTEDECLVLIDALTSPSCVLNVWYVRVRKSEVVFLEQVWWNNLSISWEVCQVLIHFLEDLNEFTYCTR